MFDKIYQGIIDGDAATVKEQVQQAIDAGYAPDQILNKGMVAAMAEVGQLFEAGEVFVPEMLIAARAMQTGLGVLRPHLVAANVRSSGKIVIGTVAGDLHDIGKNLVGMMLEGAGLEVVDLGTDVSPSEFVDAVREHQPDLIGMSALLTTTMTSMQNTIYALTEAGVREQIAVLIGGAPVTEDFAFQIGADEYAPDASTATKKAKSLLAAKSGRE